jgi:catechol 2,3-dioxygenase-like lactoylglutathione lyase family enzyme
MTRRTLVAGTLVAALAWARAPALKGITHVAFRIRDLRASRTFFEKLGFEQAFTFEDAGRTTVAFIKINDRQFIELYPRTTESQPFGLMHVCFETDGIEALRKQYLERQLDPTPINKARAGNLLFSIHDPEGRQVEYLQYLPGSLHVEDRGKHLGPNRVSKELLRVVEAVRDAAAERTLYTSRLGIGDALEFEAGGVESKTRLVFAVSRPRPTITDPDGNILIFKAPQ